MASNNSLQSVFDEAKRDFEDELPAETPARDILTVTTIDQVYDVVDKLQDRLKTRKLRHLDRIRPFLDRLGAFSNVIEVFVQAKPEILALLWGPIKLLLTITTEWQQGFDAVVKTVQRIGELLPQFNNVVEPFLDKELVKDVLGLLYRDILDFYRESLKFFTLKRRHIVFETLWPKRREKIKLIESNIERHARLLGENITFEHIKREHEARVKAFAEFQEAESFRADQKFRVLEAAVSPRMYEDRLNWLISRTCPGTAKWLENDEAFRDWIHPTSRSTTLLWLQGIPGAGKTFLACWVVEQAKAKGRTLYAFPSYTHANTTAISILLSLLFQSASNNKDLQAMLTDCNKRDLITNSSVAKELLTDMLKCAGNTFVVVDGLDEVEEFERNQLLHWLVDVWSACRDSGVKICISSRAEDDIRKILDSKAKTIYVERGNRAGINTYVNNRFDEWMATAEFLDTAKSEIRALLYPVCLKAKGMFLYARIVLDNVVDLINVDDIRRELRALPENLDAAYERVVSRINRLSTRRQCTVKRILGWIGCSPVPLTLYELEQAILVSTENHADAPSVDSSLNIVKLCGPIVEVVEGKPQFVHSTVKEYIFHDRLNFLNPRNSTLDLLTACLMYLCYDALSSDIDEDQLRDDILSGRYRLQAFASSSWFDLARQYVRLAPDEEHVTLINGLMQDLYSELKNPNYQGNLNDDEGLSDRPFQLGRAPWPGALKFISQTLEFRWYRDHPKEPWTIENAATWSHLDPLTVSGSCAKVEDAYNSLLCREGFPGHGENCPCPKLRRHYGAKLYKCHYFTCPLRRHGFETSRECESHMKNHCRPWKCSVSGCDFTVIGFETAAGLEQHRQRLHRVVREGAFTQPSVMHDEALYPLLYELVDSGNVSELDAIWPTCRPMVNDATTAELVSMAAGQGSLPVLQLLLEWDAHKQEPQNTAVKFGSVIHDAVQSGNLELARWILEKATLWGRQREGRYRDAVVAVLKSDSADIFEIWQDTVTSAGPYTPHIFQELFEKTVLNTANRFPDQQTRMFETWRQLADTGRLRPSVLGRALTNVAQTTCSIEQARTLLKLGAPIDHPREPEGGRGYTALLWASKKTSEEAAYFMRFLLLEGADPDIYFGNAVASKEEGARQIETWLNMTWDQLVAQADQQRELREPTQRMKFAKWKREMQRRRNEGGQEGQLNRTFNDDR